jgi:serine/threonine protein kinase
MGGGGVSKQSLAPPGEASATAAASEALPQVGRYQLTELLGVGGMAEVFKARCSGPGGFERTVVIKRILPANCEDPEFVRMFVAEAKILGMLHHPNVVQAYDFGEFEGTLFLVLEYVDGPSMARVVRALRAMKRPMPAVIAAHFAHEVCRALDYVHNLKGSDGEPLNVIHRDVTPSNIVLTSSGGLKLLDFGVARYTASESRSQHGTVKGKPAYLAPEMLDTENIDGRVDLFSIGVVLHEMLTLNDLFGSDNDLVTLRKVLMMPIPRPSQSRPDVPPELDAIVMKALERDPAQRYATAVEMARELNEFVVAGRLHMDQVQGFVGQVQEELAKPSPSVAVMMAAAGGGPATTIDVAGGATMAAQTRDQEGGATKRDLGLRFRMSRLGRFLFGDGHDEPH